jgi:hypothetical protein
MEDFGCRSLMAAALCLDQCLNGFVPAQTDRLRIGVGKILSLIKAVAFLIPFSIAVSAHMSSEIALTQVLV